MVDKKYTDFFGVEIEVGDLLTGDYYDEPKLDVNIYKYVPLYKVVIKNERICGIGLKDDLYLHYFRFKYCKVYKRIKE